MAALSRPKQAIRWSRLFLAIIALAVAIAFLPGRSLIPPLVESDYCYLLIAAERLYNGLGLTSLQPVAPLQPWQWQYDWAYLTQWPAGYPILIAGLRWVLHCTSVEACRIVSIIGFAAALVGWFTFIRRSVPSGGTGFLLAGLAATSCVSVGLMVNPSTDLILIAMLPFVMLIVSEALANGQDRRSRSLLITAGLLAGGLFWFRYASIFGPVAIGTLLLVEYFRRRLSFPSLIAFAVAAALPMGALIAMNSHLGPASSISAQFNLGSKIGFALSISTLWRAWWMFTDLSFYSHRPLAHWLFALLPLFVSSALFFKPARLAISQLFERIELRVSLFVLLSMLAMVVGAASAFGAKFDYIGLERYYLPVRPLYFLIFVAPVMLIPRRAARIFLSLILLSFASWTLFQDWAPTYSRWINTNRPQTPSGAWSRPFEPHANKLYEWARKKTHEDSRLLIFSNFHEYLALETGIAALPIPPSVESLQEILALAWQIRGVENARPVFVINPENLWRDYWIAAPNEIVRRFALQPVETVPAELQRYVLVPSGLPPTQADYLTLTSWN